MTTLNQASKTVVSAKELAAARELVRAARARGADLTGPDGLLKALPKTALDDEITNHLGYDKYAVEGRNGRAAAASRRCC